MKRFLLLVLPVLLLGLGISFYYAYEPIQAGVRRVLTINKNISDNGLIAYWTMDELDKEGTTLRDKGGNLNHGTLTNSPTFTKGILGDALSVNGTNQYVLNTTIASFTANTVSLWFKPNAAITTASNGGTLLSLKDTASATYFYIGLGSQTSSCANETITVLHNIPDDVPNPTSNRTCVQNQTLNAGEWYHLAISWDTSTSKYLVYLNGVALTTVSADGHGHAHQLTNGSLITAGAFGGDFSAASMFFNGSIDEVRIQNVSLSAADVAYLFTSGNPQQRSKTNVSQNTRLKDGLVGFWSFNGPDVSGTTATDISASANNGTLTNGPIVTPGIIGQALQFDGNNDYVVSASNIGISGSGARTASFWIYPTSSGGRQTIVAWGAFSDNFLWAPEWDGAVGGDNIYIAGYNNDVYTTATLPLNQWSHVAITYSGGASNTGTAIYYNGVSQAISLNGTGDTYNTTNSVLYVGRDQLGNRQPFFGKIDEVRIYNRALTAAEVAYLFTSGNPQQRSKTNVSQNTRLKDGLVGFWPFNGPDFTQAITGSSTAIDRGGSNNGSVSPSAQVVPGVIGQALNLNTKDLTTSQYIDTNAAILNTTGNFTVMAWVELASTGAIQDVISEIGTENTAGQYLLRVTASETFRFFRRDGVSTNTNSINTQAVTPGNWTHIACGYDGSLFCYFNGVNDTNAAADNAQVGQAAAETLIGNGNSNTSNVFKGKIDEVRLYNRALTVAEIQEIYLAGKRE